MSAKRLELGARARRDLATIWSWTDEHWGAEQAERYVDGLNTAICELASRSRIGHAAQVNGYWRLNVEAHAIYYRETTELLQVVRILHQHQDARHQLNREP